MTPEDLAKVKPCPFCGTHDAEELAVISDEISVYDSDSKLYQVICSCGAAGSNLGYSKDRAIELWNQRK